MFIYRQIQGRGISKRLLRFARNDRGISLIAVMIIMLIIATLALVIASMMSTGTASSVIDMQAQQALYIAEAGIENYIYLLYVETYDPDNHPDLTKTFGEGSYTVTSTYNAVTSVYTLTSTATVDSTNRVIVEGVAITSSALARAIHADSAHVKLKGSTGGTVNGNISCFTSVQNEDDLANYSDFTGGTYTITDGDEQDKILPTMDLSMYLAFAQADDDPPSDVHVATGTGVAGRITLGAGTHDGVYYATNAIVIEDGAIINGSVVCEKGITFEDGPITVTIRPELSTRALGNGNNYAALIGGEGGILSIDTGGMSQRRGLKDSTINGLVLCLHSGSDIKFNYMENSTINGTIIASGNIKLQDSDTANGRSFVINYDEDIFSPMVAGFGFTASGEVVAIPQKDWNETY